MSEYKSDDIYSFKEVILFVKEVFWEFLSKWWIFAIIILPLIGIFAYKSISSETEFPAKVRFYIEGDQGNSSGVLGGLLGSIGFGGGSTISPFQTLEILRSPEHLKQLLFSKTDCSDDYIANLILEEYEIDEKFAEKFPEFLDYRYSQSNLDSLSRREKSLYRRLLRSLVGTEKNREDALLQVKFNETNGLMVIKALSKNECLSYSIANTSYSILKLNTEEKLSKDLEQSRQILLNKRDSIKSLIDAKLFEIASFEDSNRNLISKKSNTRKNILSAETQALVIGLGEINKNYELADYQFRDFKPIFTPVEKPFYPLISQSQSLVLSIIQAIILGFILASLFVFLRMIYFRIMSS